MTGAKRLWSELQLWEWRSRLARVHPKLNEDCLIAEGRRVPELRPEIDAQKSKEDRVRVVLPYCGDERHPQPEPANPPRYGPAIDGGEPVVRCPSWFWGGGNIAQQYLAAGLLDELELHVVPVFLGDGARL